MHAQSADNPVPRWCRELAQRLRNGEPCRAEEYLVRVPAIDPEDAVELVYTEFVGREERGDALDPDEYLARFPALRAALEEQFLIHRAFREAPAAAPRIGQAVGPYRLGREIGRGSRGAVFDATDGRDDRRVALKLLLSGEYATPDDLALFRQEAGVLARLDHPNLIRILDAGVADGRPYLALEYVDGPTLARAGATFRTPRAAAGLVEVLARAVHHAHLQGVVHRDLKPGNILLAEGEDREGEQAEPPALAPKVTDFGLARVLDATSGRTRTGDIVGTLGYMAPEQAAGTAHRAGPAADVYALGAILYELLTGRPPFGPEPSARTVYEVLRESPTPPRRLTRGLPRDLETVCLRCLEKNPDRRYLSALALADDLRRFLDGRPVEARPVGAAAQVARWAVRRPSAALLAAVSALAAGGLVAGSLYHNARLRDALTTAEAQEAETAQANRDLSAALGTAESLRAETRRQKEAAERQLDEARRALYAIQLAQLPAIWSKEPLRARGLLTDARLCPPELHDFTWRHFATLCRLDEREFVAHTGGTQAGAFRADGVLVTGGADGWLRLWRPWARPDERVGPAWKAHDRGVVGVAPLGGGRVASAGGDRLVKVWDGDRPVRVIAVPAAVHGVTASPDGARVAAPCADGAVRVWDTDSGKEVAALRGHDGPVLAAAFTSDGRGLLTGGRDATVRVWSLSGGPPLVWSGHEGPVLGLAVSPDGSSAVSTGERGDVRLWDLRSGTARNLRGHLMPVRSAAFAPTGDRIATAGDDTYLKVWATDGRELTNLMRSHIQAVAFSPDGRWVAGGTADGKLLVYRLPVVPTPIKYPHPANVSAVAPRPGNGVVTADTTGEVRVWDAGGAEPVARFTVPKPDRGPERPLAVQSGAGPVVAVSPDGKTLAAGGGLGALVVWDLDRQVERGRLTGHDGNVLAVALDATGRRLASGGSDGTLRLWDLAAPTTPPAVLKGHTGGVRAVAFSPDGLLVASGGEDGTSRLWDARTGEPVRVLSGYKLWVLAVAFSPDGRLVAAGGRDRMTHVWSVDGGPPRAIAGYTNWVSAVTFSPDGRTLVTASGHAGLDTPGEVKLCDPTAGYVRAILSDVRAPVAFTADGGRLFVGVSGGLTELVGK